MAHKTEPLALGAHLGHSFEHTSGQHEIVGQQNCDRIFVVVEDSFGATDRVSQSERLILDHGVDFEEPWRLTHLGQESELSTRLQLAFKDEVLDKMGNNAVFARRSHDDQSLSARIGGLTGNQFDARCVDDRQQFLGNSLGGRQEAGAQSCSRNHGRAKGLLVASDHVCHANTLTAACYPMVSTMLIVKWWNLEKKRNGDNQC